MRARLAVGAVVVAALAGGYAVADAADVVPGILTSQPLTSEPAPFRTALPVSAASASPVPVTAVGTEAPLPDASAVQEPREGREGRRPHR
ncbi:hypothetical protein [Demequina litorisediminis]|uniref:Uncharacterized protein n=1 Tax=Demequina litorisediminis TaxID=1849022 RepID=A0ABQ6IBK5_9MICO|nr:hypothetical protein [Demequina litorisediminis]GMA35184.1 hypothetical protein GCM10025876_13880 [Demequina litorisediminis]